MVVDPNYAWKIVTLLNRGEKLSRVYREIGYCSAQAAYRSVHRLLARGILSKHVIVPLEVLPLNISVVILTRHQKTRRPCIKKPPYSVIQYYSHIGNPVEIYYVLDDCPTIEDNADTSICKLELCEHVVETITPIEKPESFELALSPAFSSTNGELKINSLDADIALDIFRLNNPPFRYAWKINDLIEAVEKRLGIKNVRYRYYVHLHRALLLRYAVKNGGDFLILLVHTSTLNKLEKALNALLKAGFITGTWQVHCLSKVPLIALVYAWGYVDKFVEPEYVHEDIDNTSYTVYPVLGVYHGALRTKSGTETTT